MNILIVSQWFDPEPNNMKALVFAKELTKLGNHVEVLTGFPNYPTGVIYDGYRLQKYFYEEMDGIPVHRVSLYPSHDSNKWKRMRNYFSFGISAVKNGMKHVRKDIDVIYVYTPPITSASAAFRIAKKRKVRVLLDINDLWPDSILATRMLSDSKAMKAIDRWCRAQYKKADRINVLSDGIKDILISRGVDADKVSVIPVWCNDELLTDETDRSFYDENDCANKTTFLYAGAIGKAQNLSVFVDVAEKIRDRGDISIILVGTGTEAESIKQSIADKKLTNIKLLPNVPVDRVVPILNCADALLIHLADDELFRSTVPSKIPLYMAVKKPIIAGLAGDAARIVSNADCGFVCQPEDVDALSNAILSVADTSEQERKQLGEKGYRYYRDNMSLSSCVREFDRILREISK